MLTYMVFMICAACSVGKVHLKGQLEQNLFEVQVSHLLLLPWITTWIYIYLLFYVAFNSQGHIGTGSLKVEEPVHTSW